MRYLLGLALALTMHGALAADSPTPGPLGSYAGRIAYVDFWASWCGPCAQSFPWLNEMQAKYGPRFAVVGVNVDTDPALAKAFLAKHPAKFDIVNDPEGRLAEHFRIDGMPSAVILDGTGRVLHQHSGFRNADRAEYEAAIRKALSTLPVPVAQESQP